MAGSISGAAISEDRLTLLRAVRDRLALELDTSSCTRDVEPLMRRLQSVSVEIDELAALREPSSAAGEIRNRREERLRRGESVAMEHSGSRRRKAGG